MDSERMSFYVLGFSVAILENVRAVINVSSRQEHFKELDPSQRHTLMAEFLFYDLHVCDRFIFYWFGSEERDTLMGEIIGRIVSIIEKGMGQELDEKLKSLVSEDFALYLKESCGAPLYETFVDAYNIRLKEYAPLKLVKDSESDNPADLLYQAFALKVAFLLGHPRNEFVKAQIINFAASVYKLMTSTKEILDKHWKS
jgi:hypothetical protein